MLSIVNVYQYTNTRGIQITVLVLSNGKSVHTTANRLKSKGISAAQIFSLIGCQINVFYFNIGEELRNGQPVTTANTIVRDFAIVKSMQMLMADAMAAQMLVSMGMTAPQTASQTAPTTTVEGVGKVDESTGEIVEPVTNPAEAAAAADVDVETETETETEVEVEVEAEAPADVDPLDIIAEPAVKTKK